MPREKLEECQGFQCLIANLRKRLMNEANRTRRRRLRFPAYANTNHETSMELDEPRGDMIGIQRGLQGMYAGTGEDAEDAFASLERELGISEPM